MFRKLVKAIMPYGIVCLLKRKGSKKVRKVVDYFAKLETNDPELIAVKEYIALNGFDIFPFYGENDPIYDKSAGMWYVLRGGRKLYFPSNLNGKRVQSYYSRLLREQDPKSAHRYTVPEFTVKKGDVIADVGAAEAIWALDNVDLASKIYIFECDTAWIAALEKTFEPFKSKVEIVQKYVTDNNDANNVTLDAFFADKKIDVIKADIEGAEPKMLKGGAQVLSKNKNLRISVAVYHRENDAKDCKEILDKAGYTTKFSNGYMIFIFDKNIKEPYYRRGLLFSHN